MLPIRLAATELGLPGSSASVSFLKKTHKYTIGNDKKQDGGGVSQKSFPLLPGEGGTSFPIRVSGL